MGLGEKVLTQGQRKQTRPGMVVYAVIPALRKLRQKDGEFKASLRYILSLKPGSQKKITKN